MDAEDLANILEEPYRDYWQALGRFIDQFASVEKHMQIMLRHYAAASEAVGRVVFSGHRINDGIDTVNRLLDARALPRVKARLRPVFGQLAQINTTRNNIVHWGVTHDWAAGLAVTSPGVLVTNRHLVQPGRTEQRYLVSLDDFGDMTADLIKIGMHFNVEMYRDHLNRQLYRRALREVLNASWSYKPPQRAALRQRSRGNPPTHRNPRPSSEA